MRTLSTLILFICVNMAVFGTIQKPDKIIYNGKEYALHSNPMESYFEKYPDKRPRREEMSTALWRGYVATFEVKDNQLYLKDIEIQDGDTIDAKGYRVSKWTSVLNEVFPNQEFVKVDRFTGLLVLPEGEMGDYAHTGYASTYEHYILLEFENGNLKRKKLFGYEEYEEFKEKQFQAFKKTDEYRELKENFKKKYDSREEFTENSDELTENFLRTYVIEYSSKILVEE